MIQLGKKVVPVEVKAGASGKLKSLHRFMHLKGLARAVRINSQSPSKSCVKLKDTQGVPVQYELISLPFYLVGQIHRLLQL